MTVYGHCEYWYYALRTWPFNCVCVVVFYFTYVLLVLLCFSVISLNLPIEHNSSLRGTVCVCLGVCVCVCVCVSVSVSVRVCVWLTVLPMSSVSFPGQDLFRGSNPQPPPSVEFSVTKVQSISCLVGFDYRNAKRFNVRCHWGRWEASLLPPSPREEGEGDCTWANTGEFVSLLPYDQESLFICLFCTTILELLFE